MSTPAPPTKTSIIESLGVYLPSKAVSSRDVIDGCRKKVRFPLERMTGIASRRVAGDGEYSIHLAQKAVRDCLSRSSLRPDDIELVVCANICRNDRPGFQVTYEPSTAIRLRHRFGFNRALAFDIASACSGMFVAIQIVDAFIKAGAIRAGMVVSGEYISHLAETAQLEIDSILDPRLACLTLGDAGAALTLREASDSETGFHAIEIDTLGRYAQHCIAGPTEEPHGGGIMHTEVLKLSNVAVRYGSRHAMRVTERAGWAPDSFQHLIMHQTSRMTLRSAMKEINRLAGKVCHADNTIDNLAERGNTASTAHFVALMDAIRAGKVHRGDRIIFAVSGSGQTIGTALYTVDDLPDRIRGVADTRAGGNGGGAETRSSVTEPRVRIIACGLAPVVESTGQDSMELLEAAALDAIERYGRPRNDLELLIYTGVYRTKYVTEPAIAALLAGVLDLNATGRSASGKRTLAFDVFNGGVGFLDACRLAGPMLRATEGERALIVAAEIENNALHFPDQVVGLRQTGSALIVESAPPDGPGFGRFHFRSLTEHLDARASHLTNRNGKTYLSFAEDPAVEDLYLAAALETARELLAAEGLEPSQIARVFPPQRSSAFVRRLEDGLGVAVGTCIDAVGAGPDLFTSSLPYGWRAAEDHRLASPGDIGLMISVGSGIQVGCALYHF